MKPVFTFLLTTAMLAAHGAELEIVVTPADAIGRVRVVKRGPNTIRKIKQQWFDAVPTGEKGHFIVEDLPEEVYDICIETGKHRVEGVDLGVGADADEPVFHWWLAGERLTVENFDPDSAFEEGTVVSEEEKAEATRRKFRLDALQRRFETIANVRKFENYARVIFASGTPDKAKALIELRRDGGHYGERGDEVIWRTEIWTFVWAHGAWVARNRSAEVLERFRFQRSEYEQLDRLYDPALGGILVKEEVRTTIEYELPTALDDRMGKAGKPQD